MKYIKLFEDIKVNQSGVLQDYGKIIGQTKSGKDVYEKLSPYHKYYFEFNKQDRLDAANLHMQQSEGYNIKADYYDFIDDRVNYTQHWKLKFFHLNQAEKHKYLAETRN